MNQLYKNTVFRSALQHFVNLFALLLTLIDAEVKPVIVLFE